MSVEPDFSSGLKTIALIIIAFLVVVLLVVFFPVRIINAGEIGVLLEFGKVKEIWHPGFHLMMPVVNNMVLMSTQIEKFEADATAASEDLQVVTTTITVNYRLPQDDLMVTSLFENFRGAHEIRIIQPLVQEVVKANTAKYTASELVTKREEVKTIISTNLKEKLRGYNIEVVEVSITNFDFSPEFNTAIEQKVVAQQLLEKSLIELQKKQVEVQQMIAVSNATATSEVIEAEGSAKAQIIKANAEATAIATITESLTDPYVRYLYIQNWDGELPKVMGSGANILDVSALVED